MNKKIYGNLDLQGNQILNFKVENIANSELANLEVSQIVYDKDSDEFVMVTTSKGPQQISLGSNFSKILVESESLGNGTLSAESNGDTLTLKEGDNVSFGYDGPNRSITLNANVDYSHQNYSEVFGDGSNLTYQITHNLGTEDVVASILIEEGASVNPSFAVERYKIINEDTIQVELNVAPGVDNLRAVVNSKHGQRGFQGTQGNQGTGAQGNQGVQGGIGNVTFDIAEDTKIVYVDGTGLSTVDEIKNSASKIEISKNVEISKPLTIEGELNTANIEVINFNYNGSLSGSLNILKVLKTDHTETETDLFTVNSNGQIFSRKIKDDLSAETEVTDYFLMGNKDGNISASTYPVGSSTVFKEKIGTLSSTQILNSFSSPIIIIEPVGGKIIDVHDITVIYKYHSIPYVWPNTTGFIITGANKFIGLLNNTMLQDNTLSIQKISPSFIENSSNKYVLPGVPLTFKTLNSNPALGDGTLKYYIRYSLIDLD